MVRIPERLEDATHDLFDVGLLNAARVAHGRLAREAVIDNDMSTARLDSLKSLKVPWWIDMKVQTPWSLADYRTHVASRLADTLQKCHPSIDVQQVGIKPLIDHWAHELLFHSVPLHAKYANTDTHKPYTEEDIILRSREDLKWIALCGYIETKNNEHPLWNKAKSKILTNKRRRIVEIKEEQKSAAKYLVGPDINLKRPTGPAVDVMREAVPELLAVNDFQIIQLAYDHRRTFRQLLETNHRPLEDMRKELSELMIDIWLQINPTTTESLSKLNEEGKPDAMGDDPVAILKAYIEPHIAMRNNDRLQKLIPLLSYQTMASAALKDTTAMRYVEGLWTNVTKIVTNLPQRVAGTAFMLCNISLADNIDDLQRLRAGM